MPPGKGGFLITRGNMKQRVGIQGSRGAYHEIAARQMYGEDVEIVYLNTFNDLFAALRSGKVDTAVVAIANIQVGFIDEPHKELLSNTNRYWISGETYVAVAHQLLGLPGTKLKDIKAIHSMAPALQQAIHTLKYLLPHAEIVEEDDTALSAEIVKKLGDKSHAAVASKIAGEINGLEVIKANVQDRKKNITRFLSLKRTEDKSHAKADKTTILLETPNQRGALFKALFAFWLSRINISTLHSSFVEDSDFNEKFFLEYDAGVKKLNSRLLMKLLHLLGHKVEVLGSYKSESINLHTK